MIEIKEKLQSVEMLFSEPSEKQYKIPAYQRRYVWNELNWDPLWTDIKEMLDEEKPIFAGIIVTYQHHEQGDLVVCHN